MKYCVLGHSIAYSLSPKLHASFFAVLGERSEYGLTDVPPERLPETVARLLREYDGFNVTKPYKESVAELLGLHAPINTVRCADKAAVTTDPQGFLCDYERVFGLPRGKILLLGAGGAAKAVANALENLPNVSVEVYNRTYEKACAIERGNIRAVRQVAGGYTAVINGTSLGLCGEQSAPPELDFAGVQNAYDLIYAPPETPFLQKARAMGAQTQNGLGMLIFQAIAAQEFWRGAPFDEDTKNELYTNAVRVLRAE